MKFARAVRNMGLAAAVLILGAFAVERALAQSPEQTQAAEPVFSYEPKLTLEDKNEQLERAVTSSSLLFDYVGEPLDAVAVLFSRAREDRRRIARALNALGYFGPRVTITIAGGGIDDIAAEDALAANPPTGKIPVEIAVAPGALFTFGNVSIVPAPGISAEPLNELPPGAAGLFAGAPALSSEVAAANEKIAAALREQGYPLAGVVGREAVADHQTSALDVTFRVDPGAKAAFGAVSIKGAETVEPDFLIGLAPFAPGDPYKAKTLEDYRLEVERLAMFNAVAIEEPASLDPDGRLPVAVVVDERPLRVVGLSASWSTLEGAALGGYWGHRNLWGRAEQLRIDAHSSRLLMNGIEDYEYALTATLTVPAFPDKRDDFILLAGAKRERPDAFERDAALIDARVRRRFSTVMRGEAGLAFVQSRETDALGTRDRTTLQLPVTLAYDDRDNILDPTTGYRANAGIQPIINLTSGSGLAGRLEAAGATYWRLEDDGETILAARLGIGATLAGDTTDLPVDLRFFAGGGGSVRGYEYQALSPRNAINQLVGGRSLAEGSVELRSWLWDDIGLAAFVDAGSASSATFPDLEDVGVGVGVGARYRTPVGPIRLDVAVPLDPPPGDAEFGVYVALGQAF